MDEIKLIIARNITDLRRKNNMTQAELAERLNYSDKAISKWERGESLPDVTVLKSVADVFRVTVDYFKWLFCEGTLYILHHLIHYPLDYDGNHPIA